MCLSYGYICTSSSIDTDGPTTTIQIDGTLVLQGIGGSMSLRPSAGAIVTLTVNGTVEVGRTFKPTGTSAGGNTPSTIVVNGGGVLKVGTSGAGIVYFHSPAQTVTGLGTFQFGGGTLQIGSNAGLDPVNGPIRTTTRSFATIGTYEYIGTAAQVTGSDLPATVGTLRTNNSAGLTLSQNTRVDTALSLTNGKLTLGSNNFTLGTSATITGTTADTLMVVAEGTGELRKEFSGIGSFSFPVGDNTGTAEYSPVTLSFTSGTFSSAYAGVKLSNTKHPSNTSTVDYINRFWTVTQSGISGFSCDAYFTYSDADITRNGNEHILWQI